MDGAGDVSILIIRSGDTWDSGSAFSIGCQGSMTEIPLSEDKMHVPGPFPSLSKIIRGSPPSLYRCSRTQSDCWTSSWNICGQSGSQDVYNQLLY